MAELDILKLVGDGVLAAVLMFLYLKQDTRLQKLEDKYLTLIDKLLDESIGDKASV